MSIEGINGVGKTSTARSAAAMLGTRCLLLDELTDQPGDTLPGRVIAALAARNDPFLRTGHPVAETLALLALQVRKAERLAGRDLAGVDVIVEDRGVDTIAVYQAVIMCSQYPETPPEEAARHVLAFGYPAVAASARRDHPAHGHPWCARGASPAGSGIGWRRWTYR